MKTSLLLLTDLWGYRRADWQQPYLEVLSPHADIIVADATVLAEISLPEAATEAELHQSFVGGGIETAAQNLLRQFPRVEVIVGCSVGGVIAWRACLAGLRCRRLVAISSTRLRHERDRPPTDVTLFFGADDAFCPSPDWFSAMGLTPRLLVGHGHEVYKSPDILPLLRGCLH